MFQLCALLCPPPASRTQLDHAAIFLQIAGSYTPIALLSFPGGEATRLLSFVWAGALAGMLQVNVFSVEWWGCDTGSE